MKYWVMVDFGSAHEIRQSDERPSDSSWQGPFDTWTDAKNCILDAGRAEIAELRSNLALWRRARKTDVIGPPNS